MSDDLPDDLVGTSKAARLAHCHPASIFRWIRSGRLRGWRRGPRYLVSEGEVRALIERVAVSEPAPQVRRREEDKAQDWLRWLREQGIG